MGRNLGDAPSKTSPDAGLLNDLLKIVEAATERLSDNAIALLICAACGVELGTVWLGCGDDGSDELQVRGMQGQDVWSDYRCRAPDVSLDAALALVERALPDAVWSVKRVGGEWRPGYRHYARVARPYSGKGDHENGEPKGAGASNTPALAVCAALLRAVQARPIRHNARDGATQESRPTITTQDTEGGE